MRRQQLTEAQITARDTGEFPCDTVLAALTDRLAQFGLSVHEGKTEFGRFAARRRAAAGQRRPETAARPEAESSRSNARCTPNVWSESSSRSAKTCDTGCTPRFGSNIGGYVKC